MWCPVLDLFPCDPGFVQRYTQVTGSDKAVAYPNIIYGQKESSYKTS